MNPDNCSLACGLISKAYISQGQQGIARREKQIKSLLSSRKLPAQGWDDATIEMFLQDCALMDSNNFIDNVGVGEREARVASELVKRRHYRLAHGIGRSGDIAAEQPKAAGSSLLAKLTVLLTRDALQLAGMEDIGNVTVLPLATGMAMTSTLLALRQKRPLCARFVLWSRIDQKTCLKAITAACLEPVVIELQRNGDELCTDMQAFQAAITKLGPENILCVMSTSSCFAPRVPDDVVALAKLCAMHDVPHVINNAYGVQSRATCAAITSAWRKGRVDAVVQSTDKNFMVPVGGSVVVDSKQRPGVVETINSQYPGRASASAHVDLLITLLHWGAEGWKKVLAQREELYPYLLGKLQELAEQVGESVLSTPRNPISVAVTCNSVADASENTSDVTFFGSMLWQRCISGTRVVPRGKQQVVAGIQFQGYGSHVNDYGQVYLTAAASVGTSTEEVDEFVSRLSQCFSEHKKKMAKKKAQAQAGSAE